MAIHSNQQNIIVKPKLPGFFIVYLLSVIPGLLFSLATFAVVFLLIVGAIFGAVQSAGIDPEAPIYKTDKQLSANTNSENKILVYNLEGAIQSGGSQLTPLQQLEQGGVFADIIKRDFQKIKEDKSIKNVVFKLNTPGGEVIASEMVGDEINELIKAKNIKTGSFYFDELSASGGLFITYKSPNYVVANPYGYTGSIGVIAQLYNISKLADNVGVKAVTLKAGKYKDAGDPFRDMTSEELQIEQTRINKLYDRFVDIVGKGRNLDKKKVLEIATGDTFFNEEAKNYGLINELGKIDLAVKHAAREANLSDDYQVVEIEPQIDPLSNLLGSAKVSNLLGIPDNMVKNWTSGLSLERGKSYMIDERMIN